MIQSQNQLNRQPSTRLQNLSSHRQLHRQLFPTPHTIVSCPCRPALFLPRMRRRSCPTPVEAQFWADLTRHWSYSLRHIKELYGLGIHILVYHCSVSIWTSYFCRTCLHRKYPIKNLRGVSCALGKPRNCVGYILALPKNKTDPFRGSLGGPRRLAAWVLVLHQTSR